MRVFTFIRLSVCQNHMLILIQARPFFLSDCILKIKVDKVNRLSKASLILYQIE